MAAKQPRGPFDSVCQIDTNFEIRYEAVGTRHSQKRYKLLVQFPLSEVPLAHVMLTVLAAHLILKISCSNLVQKLDTIRPTGNKFFCFFQSVHVRTEKIL